MSDQDMKMQFADPDWQPASSRQGRSPREQSLSVPVEIINAPDPRKPTDQSGSVDTRTGDKTGASGDYSQGYRAASSNDHHDEQPAMRIWTPGPGQTPPLTIQSTSADSSSGTGQIQQMHQKQPPAPLRLKSRRQRLLLALFARVALLVIWFTTPLVNRAFHGGWIVPLLGVLFLPLTALTYTVVSTLAGSVTGLGWLWVAGALLLDLAGHSGQTSKRRSGLPQDVK
jgi:hypothetical protein